VKKSASWENRLERWLTPFLEVLGDKRRRRWAPLYVMGLLLPGDRRSIQPISARVAPEDFPQLHHFVAASDWDVAPLEEVLCCKIDEMLGGSDSHLIVDDTSLPKKGDKSVGVAHQYCGALGKQANCQVLVSLTLAHADVHAPIGLRLYLPESWAKDKVRRKLARVPASVTYQPKWQIALQEIDRVILAGTRFGSVLADAGYGVCAEFRKGLTKRGLSWAVGILATQNMYTSAVETIAPRPAPGPGRPRTRSRVDEAPCSAKAFIDMHASFRTITWRKGTKGALAGEFAIVRVRPADAKETKDRVHLPGDEAWLVCERLSNGDRKYYLVNLPASATKVQTVASIKARWACEQMHQQAKEELGLDHFEGRSWIGLHHHALLTMIAFAFLLKIRTNENIPAA
jgi:SRSO17 transposase